MSIVYDLLDFKKEGPGKVVALREVVYGTAESWLKRYEWEYLENPLSDEIEIWVARDGDRLAGCTTRLPRDLITERGVERAYFSVNTMVDPSYRGQGIMKNMYNKSHERHPLLLSKGTTENMYNLLMKIGYQPVVPNNDMACLLRPAAWALRKVGLAASTPTPCNVGDVRFESDCRVIEGFGDEFDEFWKRASKGFSGVLSRDKQYMNWRFVSIPHRSYARFYRMDSGEIVSAACVRMEGTTAVVSDFLWDSACDAEPLTTIKRIKGAFRQLGAIKLILWATHGGLRQTLSRAGFRETADTPRFSVRAKADMDFYAEGSCFHYASGDGDADYL